VTPWHAATTRRIATLRPTEASTGSSGDSLLPWVFVAGGAALFVGGVVLFAASTGDAGTRDEMQANWCVLTKCNQNRATIPETPEAAAFRARSEDAASSGNTKQAVGLALGGLGLAAGVVGAYFFMTSKKTESSTPTARASFSPLPGGGYASASLSF